MVYLPLAMDQFLIEGKVYRFIADLQIHLSGAQKRRKSLQKVDKTLRAGIDDFGILEHFQTGGRRFQRFVGRDQRF